MAGILVALLASGLWGLGDFLGGLATRRAAALAVLAVSQPVGLLLVAAIVAVTGDPLPGAGPLLLAGLAGAAGVLALGAYYLALAVGPMGVVSPIAALGAVLPLGIGVASGDRPDLLAWLGILLALVGVALAARHHGPAGRVSARGILLAAGAALGFGCFLAAIAPAAGESVPWAVMAARAAGVAAIVAAVAAVGVPGLGGVPLRMPVAVGVFDIAANVAYATAVSIGPLSLVAVAGSLYPAGVVLLARVVAGDRLGRAQAAGVWTALAGIALISAGSA